MVNLHWTREQKVKVALAIQEKRRRSETRRLVDNTDEIKANCTTLHGFIEEFWHVVEPAKDFKTGWALKTMCDHLEAVTRGEIQFLMMNVPPGMMKSLLVAVFWPAWEWGPRGRPDLQYLATSFSQPNVLRDNAKMRRLVMSDKFQALWPIALRRDEDAKIKFSNTANGFREGRPFTAMTGGRADRVLIDDPHSVDGAESDAERISAVQTFREGISDRMNDLTKSAVVIIMQRLHADDVAGVVQDPELDMEFVVLTLPMEFEPERRCTTPLMTDPRTIDGELLFPERFPAAEIQRLKRIKGVYAWAGQYQQRPSPRDGGLFKRDWFEVVDYVPALVIEARVWDFAATIATQNTDPDWTVGLRGGRGADGIFYVTHMVRVRETPGRVSQLVNATARNRDGSGVRIRLPEDPGQAGKAQTSFYATLLAGHSLTIKRPTGSKITRAGPAASQAEHNKIKVLRAEWNTDFFDEVCMFPGARHDDVVDTLSDLIDELSAPMGYTLDNI